MFGKLEATTTENEQLYTRQSVLGLLIKFKRIRY